ncbi:MAG: MBL fold metallo-hydrolase [Sulfolobales archaeon]
MRPQLVTTEGSMTIEIYGGYREIGGNCVVIKDREKKIIFDNGIRFQLLKKYYRGRIQPLGIKELRSLGVIPPINIFDNADAVYISHYHLDHLGLLGAIPPEISVKVPSIDILEVIEEWYRASPTWLAELPHRLGANINELTPFREDELGVTPIPVSHSAYPAYAFVYRGYDKIVFYSGDLRVYGPLGEKVDTLENIGEVIKSGDTDIAILEGTNFGDIETPIGSEEFRNILYKLNTKSELLIISIDPLDYELFLFIAELASIIGRRIVIGSSRLADIFSKWTLPTQLQNVEIAVATELERPFSVPTTQISIRDEVLKEPKDFILIQEPIGFLDMLRQMRVWEKRLPSNAMTIITTPEPLETETELEERVLASWLYSLNVHVYRIRISGHYYPHELRSILSKLDPKRLIPIHTKYPKLVS